MLNSGQELFRTLKNHPRALKALEIKIKSEGTPPSSVVETTVFVAIYPCPACACRYNFSNN